MIGICSGYMAPIHSGHLEYLDAAWNYCFERHARVPIDLIVIVNNDEQTKLKGSIPCGDEDSRYDIVDALECVTHTVIAQDSDLTVAKTIEWMAQEYEDDGEIYFINSGDRQSANPKEHEICEKYGIEEVFLDLKKINSSSDILDQVGREWLKRQEKDKNEKA